MRTNLALVVAIYLLQIPLLFGQQTTTTQTQDKTCAYDEVQASLQNDPAYIEKTKTYEKAYRKYMTEEYASSHAPGTVYTIPVVVHIIHAGAALGTEANPTDETVSQIIQESSDRFRHTSGLTFDNPYSGVDTEIEFCMATTDPDGNYTTGVHRYYDPVNATRPNDPNTSGDYWALVPDLSLIQWDPDLYCNLFIVTDLPDASGVFIFSSSSNFDATLYDSGAFWSGLIAHEIGHYFSLKHTFQSACPNADCLIAGDAVCDTPPKSTSGYVGGSCGAPANSCTTDDEDTSTNNPYRSTALGDVPDILENYMDYTGGCWDAFTQGQSARMRFDIQNDRSALANSTACNTNAAPANEAGIIAFDTNKGICDVSFSPIVTIANYGSSTLTSTMITVEIDGAVVQNYSWSGSIAVGETADVMLSPITLSDGQYLLTAYTSNPNGSADGFPNNDTYYSTINILSSGLTLPYAEDFSSCTIPDYWTTLNATSVDWDLSSSSNLATCMPGCRAQVLAFAPASQTAILSMPLLDLTAYSGSVLTFDLAYVARYSFITNSLTVQASTGCGTPTVLFSEADLDLATDGTGAFSSDYHYPVCSEVETITIDLSAFDGQSQVLVEFVATGRWYNPLLMDNVNVVGTATVSCLPPTVPQVTGISGNVVKIDWTSANDAERYRVRYREVGGSWTEKLTAGTETFRFLNDLIPNTTYEYQLKTNCSSANSVWSGTNTFITLSDVCDIPASSTVTLLSATSARVDWSANTADQKYKFKYKPTSGNIAWTEYTSLNVNTKTETGLLAAKEYKYKLKTKCSGGWTNWSGNSFFTTPASFESAEEMARLLSTNEEITLSPNPVNTFLKLNWNGTIIERIKIIDINGQIISELEPEGTSEITVNVEDMPNGLYFVRFLTKTQEVHTNKFMKY